MEPRENLIDGERRPPAAGVRFAARVGEAPRWPRSTAADVEAALGVLAGAADGWAARTRAERSRIVAAASHALVEDPAPSGELAAGVGFEPGEVFPRPVPERLAIETLDAPGAWPASGEIAVVRAHSAELLEGPARATFAELVRGRAVLLISSGALPEATERIARALFAAGLPRAVLALLHDDGETALGAAIACGRATSVRVCAARDRVDALRRLVERAPLRTAFGAGVSDTPELATPHLDVPRSVPFDADPDADPEEVARLVARGAFGRHDTLGGQRAGRIGWVRIPPRSFSRVTAALLAELEAPDDRYRPAAWLDPRLPERLQTLRSWGVDEGATLIHEHEGAASRSRSGRATLVRLVFTNVEPGMRLARDLEAAPVLLLARAGVETDRDARARLRSTESELQP